MENITADIMSLMKNAGYTALEYYFQIETKFDEVYGQGWGQNHPEVIAKLATAASQDFHTMMLCKTLQSLSEKMEVGIHDIGSQLLNISESIKDNV